MVKAAWLLPLIICSCVSGPALAVIGIVPVAEPLTVATDAVTLNVPAVWVRVRVMQACAGLPEVDTGLLPMNVEVFPPGTVNVTGTPDTGELLTLTTAQTLVDVPPAMPLAVLGDPATTVVPAGNCTEAVKVALATLLGFGFSVAVIVWPPKAPPRVQLMLAMPVARVVAAPLLFTDPPPPVTWKSTLWLLTGFPLASVTRTCTPLIVEFGAPTGALLGVGVNNAATPASVVSVNVVELVLVVVTMEAVTVFTWALVPPVNVTQACPFDPVTALLPTEDAPAVVGLTEKFTVAPTTLLLLLVTKAQSWLPAALPTVGV